MCRHDIFFLLLLINDLCSKGGFKTNFIYHILDIDKVYMDGPQTIKQSQIKAQGRLILQCDAIRWEKFEITTFREAILLLVRIRVYQK